MGHIFQINRRTKLASLGRISGILMLVLLPLVWANTGSTAVTQEYEYKQKDKAEEKKRSIQRLERDKHRVAKAIETTNTLIDRSRHRPYLPELYLRLAELYIEQSRIVYLLRKNQHAEKAGPSISWNLILLRSVPLKSISAF